MLLTIDVGNTNIVFGVFSRKKLVKVWREKTDLKTNPRRYFRRLGVNVKKNINGVIVSSVVPKIDSKLRRAIKRAFGVRPVFVSHKNIGLKIGLKRKSEVGADRLVTALAVARLYGGPAIIVDFGTATTFCGINKAGEYLGGAIAPGVTLSAQALHTGTAKLPQIDVKYTGKVIGKNTIEAMRSGMYYGYVAMVEGMVSRFKKKIGRRAKVIATGGFSKLIRRKTKVIDVVNQNLTLEGLRLIWEDLHG